MPGVDRTGCYGAFPLETTDVERTCDTRLASIQWVQTTGSSGVSDALPW